MSRQKEEKVAVLTGATSLECGLLVEAIDPDQDQWKFIFLLTDNTIIDRVNKHRETGYYIYHTRDGEYDRLPRRSVKNFLAVHAGSTADVTEYVRRANIIVISCQDWESSLADKLLEALHRRARDPRRSHDHGPGPLLVTCHQTVLEQGAVFDKFHDPLHRGREHLGWDFARSTHDLAVVATFGEVVHRQDQAGGRVPKSINPHTNDCVYVETEARWSLAYVTMGNGPGARANIANQILNDLENRRQSSNRPMVEKVHGDKLEYLYRRNQWLLLTARYLTAYLGVAKDCPNLRAASMDDAIRKDVGNTLKPLSRALASRNQGDRVIDSNGQPFYSLQLLKRMQFYNTRETLSNLVRNTTSKLIDDRLFWGTTGDYLRIQFHAKLGEDVSDETKSACATLFDYLFDGLEQMIHHYRLESVGRNATLEQRRSVLGRLYNSLLNRSNKAYNEYIGERLDDSFTRALMDLAPKKLISVHPFDQSYQHRGQGTAGNVYGLLPALHGIPNQNTNRTANRAPVATATMAAAMAAGRPSLPAPPRPGGSQPKTATKRKGAQRNLLLEFNPPPPQAPEEPEVTSSNPPEQRVHNPLPSRRAAAGQVGRRSEAAAEPAAAAAAETEVESGSSHRTRTETTSGKSRTPRRSREAGAQEQAGPNQGQRAQSSEDQGPRASGLSGHREPGGQGGQGRRGGQPRSRQHGSPQRQGRGETDDSKRHRPEPRIQ